MTDGPVRLARGPLPHDGAVVDVAIVGGGVAGAATAARLARGGCAVVVFERSDRWRWHAGGVFSSPAAIAELAALGVDAATLDAVARPVPAMQVETQQGTAFRLTYGARADGTGGAVGFDRAALDEALLELATVAGADVRRGHVVSGVGWPSPGRTATLSVRGPAGRATTIRARLVIGADGIRSVVAREVRVARPVRLGRRVGITWHVADPRGDAAHDARMVVLDGAYCGLAPVPGARVNVGIVLHGRRRLQALAIEGAAAAGAQVLHEVSAGGRAGHAGQGLLPMPLDHIAGAAPLGHRVTRRAGAGWLLVGDAAGFLDPFTGEGLHRALVSARLAAGVALAGGELATDPLAYDRAMRKRFRAKDLVSLLVQAFLGRPVLFEYAARRLADREITRETMAQVIGDLTPATRALDPRFLGRLLAP